MTTYTNKPIVALSSVVVVVIVEVVVAVVVVVVVVTLLLLTLLRLDRLRATQAGERHRPERGLGEHQAHRQGHYTRL